MKKMYKGLSMATVFVLALSLMLPFYALSASAYTALTGDVDGNGSIQTRDSVIIQRYLVGSVQLTDDQLAVADVNNDGKITLIDAFRVLKYVAGYIDALDIVSNNDQSQTNGYANEVLRLVNIERANEGLPALTLDVKLCAAALVRAEETETLFEHTRPDGTACFSVLDDFDIDYWSAGENIAAGYVSPADVVAGWMNSPGHRANIMSEKFSSMGIGLYFDENSYYGYYWAQIFIG